MNTDGPLQVCPMLRIALLFMAGVWLGDFAMGRMAVAVWLGTAVSAAVATMAVRRHPVVQSCLLLLATFLTGAWWCTLRERQSAVTLPTYPITCRGVVADVPTVRGRTLRCDLLLTDDPWTSHKVRVSLLRDTVENRWQQLHVGDGIELHATLHEPRSWTSEGHFDYRRWMQVHGLMAETFVTPSHWYKAALSLERLSHLQRLRLRALMGRDRLLRQERLTGLDGQSLAVIAAMTLGDKSMLSRETREAYSISGGSHVLALSGLHLSILYVILTLVFGRRRHLLLGQTATVLALWTYAVLTGLSPSVVRATTMLTVYAFTMVAGRGRSALNTLAVTAMAMLVANPVVLWDVGFQMSFASVFSILVLYNPIAHLARGTWLLRWRAGRWAWSMICVSLAAQIGVAPLIMYYFGRFSCYFLLTNFVAVPCATLILYGTVGLFLCTPIPCVVRLATVFLLTIARWMNAALSSIASWPGASIDGIHVSALQVALMYVVVGSLYGIVHYVHKMMRHSLRSVP